MAIKAIINNTEKEIEQIKNSDEQDVDYVYSRIGDTEVEGEPPISIKSVGGNLANYRIYGQTSRNLLDENSLISPISGFTWYFDDEHYLLATNTTSDNRGWRYSQSQFFIALSAGTYTLRLSGVGANSQTSEIQVFKSNGDLIYSTNLAGKSNIVITFTLNTSDTIGIEIKLYNAKYRFMLNEGTVPLLYEPYGESVGDRTGNLFDGEVELGSWNINTQPCSKIVTNTRMRNANFIKVDENSTYSVTMSAEENVSLLIHFLDAQRNYISETTWINNISNFNTPSQCEYINIIFKKGNNEVMALSDISNIMLNVGSTALPYEPYGYKVPVTITNGADTQTTNLYLPEPLKMVGDEAEYIDYGEQKQHRVRKNFLKITYASAGAFTYDGVFISNNDGILTLNGTSNNGAYVTLATDIKLPIGTYILTGASENLMLRFQKISTGYGYDDIGAGRNINCLKEVISGICTMKFTANYTYDNVKVYPMIRKADIEDDAYEPYIENTELDVTLPALSTIKGTNTISVNTSIQPSNMYIKDNFDYKKVFTATRTIEGESPLNYRSIEDNDSTLSNYRIYGNTVDGESMGDRNGNLWNEIYDEDGKPHYVPIKVEDGEYTLSTTTPNGGAPGDPPAATIFLLAGNVNTGASTAGNGCWFNNPKTVQSIDGYVTIAYEVTEYFGNQCYPWNNNTMLNSGSTALPYEPYICKVPVTVEGKNLCNNIWEQKLIGADTGVADPSSLAVCCDFIPVKPNVTYSCSRTVRNGYNNLRCYGANKDYLGTGKDLANKGNPLNQWESFGTFMITDARVSYIRFNDFSNSLDTKYMLVEGVYTAETMPPYEPYHAPITTPVYLPEPIKMVGDEAEYIDYREQKMHKVRKNLWSGVVEQGNVSQYGDYGSDNKRIRSKNVPIEPGTYMISSNVLIRIIYAYNDDQKIDICLNSAEGCYSRSFTVPAGANNITISMMKRVDGVQVDITPSDFIWGQIEKGSEVTTYEPYIENTELDIAIPALPTIAGTNVLSIGTEI